MSSFIFRNMAWNFQLWDSIEMENRKRNSASRLKNETFWDLRTEFGIETQEWDLRLRNGLEILTLRLKIETWDWISVFRFKNYTWDPEMKLDNEFPANSKWSSTFSMLNVPCTICVQTLFTLNLVPVKRSQESISLP